MERNKRNRDFAETRTPIGVLGGILGLVVASAMAAGLIVVGVTPALATVGMAASGTIDMFERLPGYLRIGELSQKSNIYATRSDGTNVLLASFYDQNRVEVGWDQISDFAKDATVAGEDPRFYDHGGVDLQGTLRAALTTAAGRETQGGSSIAQQYVKNVRVQQCERDADEVALEDLTEEEIAALTGDERFALVEDARLDCYDSATETSIDRKLKEMRLAIGVEKRYSKNEILLGYLNIAGFGGTVYGIEAAANYYYSTSAANLTLPQAASLVAIVNNPVKFQLDKPESETNGAANGYAANTARRNYLLRQMEHEKKITPEQYEAAIATPVEPVITEPSTGCQTAKGAAYFCDYVKHILQNDPTFGDDDEERLLNFRRGGYQVYTSLDLDLQAAAERAIAENVPSTYPGWDVGAVISSVQVGTGRVLAMAQNKVYSQDPKVVNGNPAYSGINYNTDYDYGGSSGFQPGSSYKVFTLAEWLASGHALTERVNSSRKSNWGAFNDSCLGTQYADPGWNPRNDANEPGGRYSALESTIGSINTGFLGMAKLLDQCGIANKARAFGVHRADGDPLVQFPSAVLGINEVAPLSMAVAFAGIANNGVACTPIAIDRIVGPDGAEITPPKSACAAAVTPAVAGAMHYAMSRVMEYGTGYASSAALNPWVPVIGKTGTTDGAKDTWMVGASMKVATAAAVVSVNGDANQRGISFASGEAATARHRMWPIVMSAASAKYGGGGFTMAGPEAVAPLTSPTPFDDIPLAPVEPSPSPSPSAPAAPAPAPAPAPSPDGGGGGDDAGQPGDRTLEPRDDGDRGGPNQPDGG
ncbi:membrane peptidoglycan carboxypeptidase [Agromyces terreus]|uniref:Membrane peptidoglycan carboxypeptidase n=1 Tax=Agromyces terreus TaxID=424795 RepID=A0A9X2H0X5_9MICO|nr:transglycosylase domain-containing protein [Agromyces terreus]MCP2372277.1 membrane peptidoglycan carboxypeptidase [Agromyces terreus]